MMEIEYGIPFVHISRDEWEMTGEALSDVARYITTRLNS